MAQDDTTQNQDDNRLKGDIGTNQEDTEKDREDTDNYSDMMD